MPCCAVLRCAVLCCFVVPDPRSAHMPAGPGCWWHRIVSLSQQRSSLHHMAAAAAAMAAAAARTAEGGELGVDGVPPLVHAQHVLCAVRSSQARVAGLATGGRSARQLAQLSGACLQSLLHRRALVQQPLDGRIVALVPTARSQPSRLTAQRASRRAEGCARRGDLTRAGHGGAVHPQGPMRPPVSAAPPRAPQPPPRSRTPRVCPPRRPPPRARPSDARPCHGLSLLAYALAPRPGISAATSPAGAWATRSLTMSISTALSAMRGAMLPLPLAKEPFRAPARGRERGRKGVTRAVWNGGGGRATSHLCCRETRASTAYGLRSAAPNERFAVAVGRVAVAQYPACP
jgi:hypothetical protein